MEAVTKPLSAALDVSEATATALLLGLLLISLIAVLLSLCFRKASGAKDKVLFVGLSEAGKTHIFLNLVTGPERNEGRATTTYTSVQENAYEGVRLDSSAAPVSLVDIPGADKVRAQALGKHLSSGGLASLKAIVFVVDASTFAKSAKDVASLLYQVLAGRRKGQPPLAVLAHKQDLPTAKAPAVLRATLQKEFALLEKSRAAALDSTTGEDGGQSLGAVDWDSLAFLPTSGLPNEESNLRPLRDFLLGL